MKGFFVSLKQPAFVAGLVLGLCLSTLLTQVLFELEKLSQTSNKKITERGYHAVTFKTNSEDITQYSTRNLPPESPDMKEIINAVVEDRRFPSYLLDVHMVQTNSLFDENKDLASKIWGSDILRDVYNLPGNLHALEKICDIKSDRYWHLIISDATYVNPAVLHVILKQLSPDQNIAIGLSDTHTSRSCQTVHGFLMSHHFLRNMCTRCLSEESQSEDISKCSKATLTDSCVNIDQVFPAYPIATLPELNKVGSSNRILSKSAVINLNHDTWKQVHSLYRQVRKQELENYINTLSDKINQEQSKANYGNLGNGDGWKLIWNDSKCSADDRGQSPRSGSNLFSVVYQSSSRLIQKYSYNIINSNIKETINTYKIDPISVQRKYFNRITTVYIVSMVPLNLTQYAKYLEHTSAICRTKISPLDEQRCQVYMVIFKDDLQSHGFSFSKFKEINNEIESRFSIDIKVGEISGEPFSLGRMLQIVADSHEPEDLILIMDARYIFNIDLLNRCIANAEMSSTVYYPLSPSTVQAYDVLCLYSSDIQNIDALPASYKELYQIFTASSDIQCLSAPEPSLVLL